jgi:hypothetical protein
MRYLIILACTAVLGMASYVFLIPALGPTPVAAEYWVQEMLTIKQDIAKKHSHERKIVIASGSSTLFSIDTSYLSKELGMPVINYGLMGGMALDKILSETSAITNRHDIVILALEPDYYCREENKGFDEWLLRNAIAWDHNYWNELSLSERLLAIRTLGLRFPLEMLQAQFDLHYRPEVIEPRLTALNSESVLRRFSTAQVNADNLYSVYTMDSLGNIKNTNENSFTGEGNRADQAFKICKNTLGKLEGFVTQQKTKGVAVYFIHTPFVNRLDLDSNLIDTVSQAFSDTLSPVAQVLDDIKDVIFDRTLFLNSALHLNALGREARSNKLLVRLRNLIEPSPSK